MAEIRQFGRKGLAAAWQEAAPEVPATRDPARSPQKYCVYNQTQERFVATDVNQTLAQLIPLLNARGIEISELHAQKATLEEVIPGLMDVG